MDKKIKWLSTTVCDICEERITDTLYDAKTKFRGIWATMCQPCYTKNGIGHLGLGLGQRYEQNELGEFIKVEG